MEGRRGEEGNEWCGEEDKGVLQDERRRMRVGKILTFHCTDHFCQCEHTRVQAL